MAIKAQAGPERGAGETIEIEDGKGGVFLCLPADYFEARLLVLASEVRLALGFKSAPGAGLYIDLDTGQALALFHALAAILPVSPPGLVIPGNQVLN